jgi:outer membrane protein OmpA-like peptidoglycan-associated protein
MKLLGSTYFNLNSFALSLAVQKALKAFAARITRSSSDQVLIYGNTDSQPGLDNSILSKRRALAVAKFIRPLLTKKKISIGWFADSRPAVKGKSLAAVAKNRRVEIWLTSKN